jgi:type IX secretion system PorP/SprF family membrane protein
MTLRKIAIFIMLLLPFMKLIGQETSYGSGYQSVLINNPAFAGSEGDGTLRLSYLNFYPGNGFNLHSVFVTYDSYMPVIHGGAGIWISDDYLGGIINDMRGGLAYSYHFRANKDLFINAGLSASIYYRGINNSGIILPDQIDPVNGVSVASGETISERGRAVFDIGTGVVVIGKWFIGSLAINHLTSPDLGGEGLQSEKVERKLVMNIAGNFEISRDRQISARPVMMAEIQGSSFSGGAGASVENNSLSFSTVFLVNKAKDVDLQAGCSVKSGKILFYYSYRFNIFSANKMLPLSLMHQAGLAFSLNYVDKRKVFKTIIYPKL